MTRDFSATQENYAKPAALYAKFVPALQGKASKMSSSDALSSILLTDKADAIKKKINKYAFSGGGATTEEHRLKGGNLEVDIPYQLL